MARKNPYETNYTRLEELMGQPLGDLHGERPYRLRSDQGFMDLVVEKLPSCPETGAMVLSLCHYFEQHGGPMPGSRDDGAGLPARLHGLPGHGASDGHPPRSARGADLSADFLTLGLRKTQRPRSPARQGGLIMRRLNPGSGGGCFKA